MSARNIIKSYLRKAKGCSLLGVGCYSAVMDIKYEDNKVLKVGSDGHDHWVGYYKEYIRNSVTSVHTPIVYKYYEDPQQLFYVAVIEKLSPIVTADDRVLIGDINLYCNSSMTAEKFVESLRKHSSIIPNANDFLVFINSIIDNSDVVNRFGNENDDFDPEPAERLLDLHTGNWMIRDNNTLVLIDPWCDFEMEDTQTLDTWADENLKEPPLWD